MENTLTPPTHSNFRFVRAHNDYFEYVHKKNSLRVIVHTLSDTGVITANIVYTVGSKHELPGQTGLAHMLEHMLFKPTASDLAKKQRESSIMALERNVGVVINASTWKDRTNYYCTAPKALLNEILAIYADQMQNVVINKNNLKAEQTTVLSEFDMYNSDPHFALESAVATATYLTHPYRHETIGVRSDIEGYTAEALNAFYRQHYVPNVATVIIVGDVSTKTALTAVDEAFGAMVAQETPKGVTIIEPPQEGIRRVSVVRKTTTNLLTIASKAPAFGTPQWLTTMVLLKILADGPDSILHRSLVDTGKVTGVDYALYPTAEPFLASINCTLSSQTDHDAIEKSILAQVRSLTATMLKDPLKKTIAQICYAESFSRDSSSGIAAELTEYVALDDWTPWCTIETQVQKITTKDILEMRDRLFTQNSLTIGTFIGSNA